MSLQSEKSEPAVSEGEAESPLCASLVRERVWESRWFLGGMVGSEDRVRSGTLSGKREEVEGAIVVVVELSDSSPSLT